MPTSRRLIRITKASLLALGLLLLWAPVSQAGVYTGSATDPPNDLSPLVGGPVPSPPVDFTSVSVRYDDVAGRVDVSFGFSRAPASYQSLQAGVGLGTVQADGSCSAPYFADFRWRPVSDDFRGEAYVEGFSTNFTGSAGGGVFDYGPGGGGWGTAAFGWSASKRTWDFATIHPSLVGRHYNCVNAGMVVIGNPPDTYTDPGVDWLTGSFALSAVSPVAPSASWLSPRDGQTVSGLLTEVGVGAQRCLARITGPVVRTENYVDGKLNDTQVYSPWGCVWDTRNYVNGGHLLQVKAYDAADNVIAADTVRVTVDNPNPPPVSNPPPPGIETSPGVVVPSGSTGSQPNKPAPRFTRQKARRAVKRALARHYGKAFRLRKGYTAACLKTSPSRWSCAVRWRYGQFSYKGKVKLTLRSDGRVASRFVLRKTFQ